MIQDVMSAIQFDVDGMRNSAAAKILAPALKRCGLYHVASALIDHTVSGVHEGMTVVVPEGIGTLICESVVETAQVEARLRGIDDRRMIWGPLLVGATDVEVWLLASMLAYSYVKMAAMDDALGRFQTMLESVVAGQMNTGLAPTLNPIPPKTPIC